MSAVARETADRSVRVDPAPQIRRLASRTVYENPWMSVREDEIERPDGSQGIYGVVDKRDFALVVPVEDGGFHLVNEYRYPIARRAWNFPQGGFPDGRTGTPEQLARAELAEETGITAGRMVRLGYLHCSHGFSSQGFTVFLATGLSHGRPRREHEEQDMRHEWVSRAEFVAMTGDGRITDDSSLAAYALLLMYEERAAGSAG